MHAQATAVLLFETRKLIYKTTHIILPRQLTPICPFIFWETYRICNFLANCCDYTLKQYKAPEVYETSSKTGSGIRILYLLTGRMWPGPRPASIPSGILIHPAIWPQQIWADNWELTAVPLSGRGAGSPIFIKHNLTRDEAYLHVKFHLDPSNRLATIHQRYKQDDQDRQTDNGPLA